MRKRMMLTFLLVMAATGAPHPPRTRNEAVSVPRPKTACDSKAICMTWCGTGSACSGSWDCSGFAGLIPRTVIIRPRSSSRQEQEGYHALFTLMLAVALIGGKPGARPKQRSGAGEYS